ncbi:uncharacterized protein ACMZJ9_018374 [Mantella aurantiaca]
MQLPWNMLLLCSLAIVSHHVVFARPASGEYAADVTPWEQAKPEESKHKTAYLHQDHGKSSPEEYMGPVGGQLGKVRIARGLLGGNLKEVLDEGLVGLLVSELAGEDRLVGGNLGGDGLVGGNLGGDGLVGGNLGGDGLVDLTVESLLSDFMNLNVIFQNIKITPLEGRLKMDAVAKISMGSDGASG